MYSMEVVCIPVHEEKGQTHSPTPLQEASSTGNIPDTPVRAPELLPPSPAPRALTVLADPGVLLPGCDFMGLRLLLFLTL